MANVGRFVIIKLSESTISMILCTIYIIGAPVAAAAYAWYFMHWLLALGAVFILPLFIFETLSKLESEPTFQGSFKHPGGLIGGIVAVGVMQHLFLGGFSLLGVFSILILFPLLVILFSFVSDSAIYVIKSWFWNRSRNVSNKDLFQDSDADVPMS